MRIESAEDYFRTSLERMAQARRLYEEGNSYALSMYVSGLAVECLLRAFKALRSVEFDEKHDLRRLFKASGLLELDPDRLRNLRLTEAEMIREQREIQVSLSAVYFLWDSAHRYASEERMRAYLKGRRLDRGLKGDILKTNALALLRRRDPFTTRAYYDGSHRESRAILTRAFPPPDRIELEDDDGIVGAVISERFVGMDFLDRINIIWDELDRELTKEERRQVVTIVAGTPYDEAAYLA